MVAIMWFVLGGLFGGLLTLTYIKVKQMEAMERMITRLTKDLLKHGGDNDDN
jgi:hypothetical protein